MSKSIDLTTPMQLIYKPKSQEERIVVAFPEGLSKSPIFGKKDTYLELAMKITGIAIPLQNRQEYPECINNDRRLAIYLDDPSFGKAFYSIYFSQNMDPQHYQWKKIKN